MLPASFWGLLNQLLPRNDRLSDTLVPPARAKPGHRLLSRSCSRRLFSRLARGGMGARSPLVVRDRMAVALYSGRKFLPSCLGSSLSLSDGLACTGALASSGRTELAGQRIAI